MLPVQEDVVQKDGDHRDDQRIGNEPAKFVHRLGSSFLLLTFTFHGE